MKGPEATQPRPVVGRILLPGPVAPSEGVCVGLECSGE